MWKWVNEEIQFEEREDKCRIMGRKAEEDSRKEAYKIKMRNRDIHEYKQEEKEMQGSEERHADSP
jgi:hypothetical protein